MHSIAVCRNPNVRCRLGLDRLAVRLDFENLWLTNLCHFLFCHNYTPLPAPASPSAYRLLIGRVLFLLTEDDSDWNFSRWICENSDFKLLLRLQLPRKTTPRGLSTKRLFGFQASQDVLLPISGNFVHHLWAHTHRGFLLQRAATKAHSPALAATAHRAAPSQLCHSLIACLHFSACFPLHLSLCSPCRAVSCVKREAIFFFFLHNGIYSSPPPYVRSAGLHFILHFNPVWKDGLRWCPHTLQMSKQPFRSF